MTEWNERHWVNLLMFRVYWQISGTLSGRACRQVAVMSLIGLCGVKLCSLCARGRHKNPCEHTQRQRESAFMRKCVCGCDSEEVEVR